MRTRTAGQIAATTGLGAEVHRFLAIDWPAPGTETFYSERSTDEWSPEPGYTFHALLMAWPVCDAASDIGTEPVGQLRSVQFTLLDPNETIFAALAATPPIGAKVQCWHVWRPVGGGDAAAADWQLDGVYRIASYSKVAGGWAFSCEDRFAEYVDSSVATEVVTTAEFPSAPTDSLGKTVPVVIGAVPGVPVIPTNGGRASTLYAGVLSVDTTIYVADSDATAWPASGTMRIDAEILTYSSVTAGSGFLAFSGCARGLEGSSAADHAAGATVTLLLDATSGGNPKAYQFLLAASALTVSQVYLDGQPLAASLWSAQSEGAAGRSTLRVNRRLPLKLTGTNHITRNLNEALTGSPVSQAIWALLQEYTTIPVAEAQKAIDGDTQTFVTLTANPVQQSIAVQMMTNLSGLGSNPALRAAEVRVRWRAYTPKAGDWPAAAPSIACYRQVAGVWTPISSAAKNIVAPADMNAATNLYPESDSSLDSKYLFDGAGASTSTTSKTLTTTNFRYASGFQQMPASNSSVYSWFGPTGTPPVAGDTPTGGSGYNRMRSALSGSDGLSMTSQTGFWTTPPDLQLYVDPAQFTSGKTYSRVTFSIPIATANEDWPWATAVPRPGCYVLVGGRRYEGTWLVLGKNQTDTLVVECKRGSIWDSFTYDQMVAARFCLSCAWPTFDDHEFWQKLEGYLATGNWAWESFGLTCDEITTTDPATLNGKTTALVAGTLVPSALVEQRIDLTGVAGGNWGLFDGKFAVAMVIPPCARGSAQWWIYDVALYVQYTEQQWENVPIWERTITADVEAQIGGASVTAETALPWLLTAPAYLGLASSEVDSASLTAALALAGSSAWPLGIYLSRATTKADLLASLVACAGLRYAYMGGYVRFFAALLVGTETAEPSVLTMDPDAMATDLSIDSGRVENLKNRLTGNYALAPSSGDAGAVVQATTAGTTGDREVSLTWAWVRDVAVAAALAARRLSDSAVVATTLSFDAASLAVDGLEVGDAVTVSDRFIRLRTTRGRVIGLSPQDATRTRVTMLTPANVNVTTVTAPTVETASASGITSSGATLNGYLLDAGGESPTVHLVWGATDGGTTAENWDHDVNLGTLPAGGFSADVADLTAGATYYFRVYATNSAGTGWASETVSFEAGANVVLAPSVANLAPTNVTNISATLNGRVTNTGGEDPTVHVFWGSSDGATTAVDWEHDENLGALAAGDFSVGIAGLTPGVTYFFRCYAENSAGGTWASETIEVVAIDAPITLFSHTWEYGTMTLKLWPGEQVMKFFYKFTGSEEFVVAMLDHNGVLYLKDKVVENYSLSHITLSGRLFYTSTGTPYWALGALDIMSNVIFCGALLETNGTLFVDGTINERFERMPAYEGGLSDYVSGILASYQDQGDGRIIQSTALSTDKRWTMLKLDRTAAKGWQIHVRRVVEYGV